MLIEGRRRWRPRRSLAPQAQAAQQRLQHASAPPSLCQVSSSSKVHRREEYFASVQMKLVIFTLSFCSFAECSSPAATASHRRRQRSRQRPGRHDPERAIMLITGRRRRRPRRGFVPQVQAAQQRLQYASAPPSYGQVSSSSNVHRREGHLASVQMKLVIFTPFF